MNRQQGARRPSDPTVSLRDVLALLERRRRTWIGTTLAVLVLSFLWLATQRPRYQASATVLIDQQGAQTGILAQLAAIGSAPAASSEMAILRSRDIALRTVWAPVEHDVQVAELREDPRHLGLTTLVDDEELAVLDNWKGDALPPFEGPRLSAWVRDAAPDAPLEIGVKVVDDRHLKVSRKGFLPFLGGHDETVTLDEQGVFRFEGLEVQVHVSGDAAGHRWTVRRSSEEEAVRGLLERTEVVEIERSSGVVRITVEDSDPWRAARTANALAENYLDANLERARRSPRLAAAFVDEQLASQLESLDEAERELVALRTEHPETVDVTAAAGAMIERASKLEAQRIEVDLGRESLEAALALLRDGEFEALSRLQAQFTDPVTLGYLEAITRLVAESETLERSDAGAYKLLLQQRVEELRAHFETLDLRHETLAGVLAALDEGDDAALARLAGRPEESEPVTEGYLAEYSRLRAAESRLAQQFKEGTPELVELRRSVTDLRHLIRLQVESRLLGAERERDETSRLIEDYRVELDRLGELERGRIDEAVARLTTRTTEHLESRLAGLAASADALDEQIAGCEDELARLPEIARAQADPQRRLAAHEQVVEALLLKRQEVEIAEASTLPTAEVIDEAVAPRFRHFPKTMLSLGLAGVLGVLLGCGLALLQERVQGSLASEAELEELTGLPCFGSIPDHARGKERARRAAASFVAMRDAPTGPESEAYRAVRTNLRFALEGGREPRTFAVTSCMPGEGKSTTNINLAMAYAGAGARVLLVDCDLRRNSVDRYLRIPAGPGLAEALAGQPWRDALNLVAENLFVLPAGTARGAGVKALAGSTIEGLIDEFAAEFDVVVFDVPPALSVADLEGFAHRLDAVLLLYRSEGHPSSAVETAVRRLRQSGAPLVGCLMNGVRALKHSGYYQYGYGDYGSETEAA